MASAFRIQAYERERETAENFLDAYMGYRRAMLDLQGMTYYDFEYDVPVLERYGIRAGAGLAN